MATHIYRVLRRVDQMRWLEGVAGWNSRPVYPAIIF